MENFIGTINVSGNINIQSNGSAEETFNGLLDNTASFKELLACLVEKQGDSITREQAYCMIWENTHYDRSAQKQLDVVIRSLRTTLEEYGISEILSMQRGMLRIEPRMFSCDMYRMLLGDAEAIGEYRGEYMNAYSWASLEEAYLERRIENIS